MYIKFNWAQFILNKDRVLFVISHLCGSVYRWFQSMLTDYLESVEKKDNIIRVFSSYNQFKINIKKIYKDVNKEQTAEQNLQTLKQTTSVTEYTSKFQQITAKVEWNDTVFTAKFYLRLKDSVKNKFIKIKRPDELNNIIKTAIKIDNRLYKRQLEKSRESVRIFYRKHKTNIKKYINSSQQIIYPVKMNLDATFHKKKSRVNKDRLSDTQKCERTKKQLCYYCRKPGYQTR